MAIHKLTAKQVENLKKPGRYGDGGNLWLQVSQWGTKSWIFRFTLDGRPRQMGLGSLDSVSLEKAREKAKDMRGLVADGIDPVDARKEEKRKRRIEKAKRITFREAAAAYIAKYSPSWKNPKHAMQWPGTMRDYVNPVIGDMMVDEIDVHAVYRVLEPIWYEKTETASRTRGRIEKILGWATTSGYRTGDNPAAWRGNLENLLPKKSAVATVKHHAALHYDKMPALMAELAESDTITAKALRFGILTAARPGEVRGATWAEIDLDKRLWTIPAERMKAKKEHKLPLSDMAIDILNSVPRLKGNPFVFVGGRKLEKGLSENGMANQLKNYVDPAEATVHGMRSCFKDWCTEKTSFDDLVSEVALAHMDRDKVRAAYARGDIMQKRVELMDAWARYCTEPADETGKVIAMHGAKK